MTEQEYIIKLKTYIDKANELIKRLKNKPNYNNSSDILSLIKKLQSFSNEQGTIYHSFKNGYGNFQNINPEYHLNILDKSIKNFENICISLERKPVPYVPKKRDPIY